MTRGWMAAALLVALMAPRAEARNPHCSGGILYVTQAMRDKDKGDRESYERQIRKAVTELSECTTGPGRRRSAWLPGLGLRQVDSRARRQGVPGLDRRAGGRERQEEGRLGDRQPELLLGAGVQRRDRAHQGCPAGVPRFRQEAGG
jgi:hypothetical protein